MCPFYINDNRKTRIYCEGLLDRTTFCHDFQNKKDYEAYMKQYCIGNSESCMLHQLLMQTKYSDS